MQIRTCPGGLDNLYETSEPEVFYLTRDSTRLFLLCLFIFIRATTMIWNIVHYNSHGTFMKGKQFKCKRDVQLVAWVLGRNIHQSKAWPES